MRNSSSSPNRTECQGRAPLSMEAISLEEVEVKKCLEKAGDPEEVTRIMKCTGDRSEKVVHVLTYMGRHGGGTCIKSCESSSLHQGTLAKYNSPVSRTIDGQSV